MDPLQPASAIANCPWSDFAPAAMSFCERRLCHWIVEPANTWSNIGFIIVGILIARDALKQKRRDLLLVGFVSVLVGIGSTMFHLSGTRLGEVIDVSAMYLISSLFLAFTLKRFLQLKLPMQLAIYFGTAIPSILYLVFSGSSGIILFAAKVTVSSLLEIRMRRKWEPRANYFYLNLVALFFGFSFLMWGLDVSHTVCNPDNHILGGHAVWHLSNAIVLWCYYKYQQQFGPSILT